MGTKTVGMRNVIEKTGLSRSTIYRLERAGDFPSRRQLSPGRIGFFEIELEHWIQSRLKSRIGIAK